MENFRKMSDQQINEEFEAAKQNIIIKNYIELMSMKLIPFYTSLALANGENKDQEEIWQEAHEAFCNAKKLGTINDLNQIVSTL